MNSFWPRWRENPVVAGLLVLLLVALIGYVGLKARNTMVEYKTIGTPAAQNHTFTIDGDGRVSGKPTLGQIDLGLLSEGTEVATVQTDNTQKVNAITAGLKAMGISADDIQTSNYSISPKYDYTNGSSKLVGYTVSQSLTVKVRDMTKLGAVLAKAGQLGSNQVNGVSFTIDDPTELKQQARKKALENARTKAQELADALGVEIVRVVSFSESSGQNVPQPYYRTMAEGMGGGPAAVPDIQTGSLDVQSQVSVTFEIR